MEEHEVYELFAAPSDTPNIGSQWGFSYDMNECGNISVLKACLVIPSRHLGLPTAS